MKIFFLLLAVMVASFATAQISSNLPVVKWSTFQAGTASKLKTFETRVISTEGAWQKYWVTLTGNPASTAPRGLEWSKEELWVIALGERRTGGCNLYVRSAVFVDARNVHVEYVETSPPPGAVSTQVMTSPYVVIRVERCGGSPQFVRCEDAGFNYGGTTVILPNYSEEAIRPLRWGLLDRGQYSNVTAERTFALASRREYEYYAKNAFPNNSFMLELGRDVRWEDEMVVAIHSGSKARYTSVEVDRATVDNQGRVQITWFESVPIDGQMTRCTPYLLMRIPRYTTSPSIRKTYGRS